MQTAGMRSRIFLLEYSSIAVIVYIYSVFFDKAENTFHFLDIHPKI
jgi:hypothetical protein